MRLLFCFFQLPSYKQTRNPAPLNVERLIHTDRSLTIPNVEPPLQNFKLVTSSVTPHKESHATATRRKVSPTTTSSRHEPTRNFPHKTPLSTEQKQLIFPKQKNTDSAQKRYTTATKSPSNPVKLKPNLENPTNPALSRVILKSHQPYQICDTLEITIEARDVKNKPKQYGGDYFWTWIHNSDLRASAPADEIIDHQNGNYTARFKLHWSGKVNIVVNLMHSSEAISVLRRVRDTFPARCSYQGKFQTPNITRFTPCHITQDMYIVPSAATANKTFCNFTEEKTGFPWFCVKPKDVSCDAYVSHRVAPDFGSLLRKVMVSVKEGKLFLP